MSAALKALPGGRVPAHDDGAERGLIACCMADPDCHAELAQAVRPTDFYRDAHGLVWGALQELDREHVQADTLTVRERLERAGKLGRVGGDEALLDLQSIVPTMANAEYFAARVRDLARVRAVVAAAHQIAAEGYTAIESVADYLARAERALSLAIDDGAGAHEPVPIATAVDEAIRALVARTGGEGAPRSTGLPDLDFVLGGGLWPGEVTVLAGRPGTGKTALAMQVARAVDRRHGPVLVHELEMPRQQLAQRMLAQEAHVDGNAIRICRLTAEQMERMERAGADIAAGRITIEDTGGVSIGDIARNARRQKRRGGLALLVIDYLQLLRPIERDRSREREVAEISKAIKRLAKDLATPVLVLASLNRDSESKGARDRRPTIAQLRESGSIESDADNVLLLYRDDLGNPNSERPGQCDVIIGKQRNGMTGEVALRFVREHTRFESLERWRDDG